MINLCFQFLKKRWTSSTLLQKMSKTNKYAVVQFLSDSTFSEIPTAWLFKEGDIQKCWWPPRTTNCATLVIHCEPPDVVTWNHYEVENHKILS